MGKCEEKQETILSLLRQHGRLSVADVVSVLQTSEATVRRYFSEMEQRGQLIRVFGGVCSPSAAAVNEYRFSSRAASNQAEKRCIGFAAASLITPHDRIFFDSGTTVRECGNALVEISRTKRIQEVSIVTSSLVYDENLPQVCTLSLIGGMVRPNRMDLCGLVALNNLERYNFTKTFLGVDGISETGELTTTDEETSFLAASVIKRSSQIYILADSGKLGVKAFASYGNLQASSFTLITDKGADKELLDKFRNNGVNVMVAN